MLVSSHQIQTKVDHHVPRNYSKLNRKRLLPFKIDVTGEDLYPLFIVNGPSWSAQQSWAKNDRILNITAN